MTEPLSSINAVRAHAKHDMNASREHLGTLTERNVSTYHRGTEVQRDKKPREA